MEDKITSENNCQNLSSSQSLPIVYMVAGLSSRFGGKIKQFARVGPNDETLIECSIKQAKEAGFNEIVFIVGDKTEIPFKEMFGDNYLGMKIKYAKQTFNSETRDKPWGTVDALVSAVKSIDAPFVVCNGDDIYGIKTLKLMADFLKNPNNKGLNAAIGYKLGEVIPEKGAVNRAIFQTTNDYIDSIEEVIGIEKSKLSEMNLRADSLASLNIFALNPNVLDMLSKTLNDFKQKNNADRKIECLLPTEISRILRNELVKMKIFSSPQKWFGVTNPEDEALVREELKRAS